MGELKLEKLWKIEDLCKHLGVSKSWVYAKLKKGEIPRVKLPGRPLRFDPQAILNLTSGDTPKVTPKACSLTTEKQSFRSNSSNKGVIQLWD